MKKVLAMIMSLIFIVALTAGCSDSSSSGSKILKQRLNYKAGLENKVAISGLDTVVVDRSSTAFLNAAKSHFEEDAALYGKIFTGKVKKGDLLNIDYSGKLDGVVFEGGTATGQFLEIGSGQFIPGFEDQLIGVEVGSTVDINVTFPKEYHAADLAGKPVVFTVTVNYISPKVTKLDESFIKAAGFNTKEEYLADLEQRAAGDVFAGKIITASKILEMTPDSEGNSFAFYKSQYALEAKNNNTTYEAYLAANNVTEAMVKISDLKTEMVMYALLDQFGMTVPKDAVTEEANRAAEMTGSSAAEVISAYGNNYIEAYYVRNAVSLELAKRYSAKISGPALTEKDIIQ